MIRLRRESGGRDLLSASCTFADGAASADEIAIPRAIPNGEHMIFLAHAGMSDITPAQSAEMQRWFTYGAFGLTGAGGILIFCGLRMLPAAGVTGSRTILGMVVLVFGIALFIIGAVAVGGFSFVYGD